jgi:hypothetical protein
MQLSEFNFFHHDTWHFCDYDEKVHIIYTPIYTSYNNYKYDKTWSQP